MDNIDDSSLIDFRSDSEDAAQKMRSEFQDSTIVKAGSNLVNSFVQAGIQNPYNGVAELVNHAGMGSVLPAADLVQSQPAEFGSADWHAQQVGAGLGMAADLYLLSKVPGVKKVFGSLPATAASAEVTVGRTFGQSILEAGGRGALAGMAYEGLFRPTNGSEDFLTGRLRNAMTGGIVFGATTAAGMGINSSLDRIASRNMSDVLAKQATSAILSGSAGGFIGAHSGSLMSRGEFADSHEVQRSMYEFAFMNTALTGLHALESRKATVDTTPADRFAQDSRNSSGFRDSLSQFGERLAMSLDTLFPRPQLAFAMEGSASFRPNNFKFETASKPSSPMIVEMRATADSRGGSSKGSGKSASEVSPAESTQDALSWAKGVLEPAANLSNGPLRSLADLKSAYTRGLLEGDVQIDGIKGEAGRVVESVSQAESAKLQAEQALKKCFPPNVSAARALWEAQSQGSKVTIEPALEPVVKLYETIANSEAAITQGRAELQAIRARYDARQAEVFANSENAPAPKRETAARSANETSPARQSSPVLQSDSGAAKATSSDSPSANSDAAPARSKSGREKSAAQELKFDDVMAQVRSGKMSAGSAIEAVNKGLVVPSAELQAQSWAKEAGKILDRRIRTDLKEDAVRQALDSDVAAASERGPRAFTPASRGQVEGKLGAASKSVSEFKGQGYLRPLKSMQDAAKAAQSYVGGIEAGPARLAAAQELVPQIEKLFDGLKGSRRGAEGGRSLPDARHARSINAEQRLAQIVDHLDARVREANKQRESAVQTVANNPIITAISADAAPGGVIKQQLYKMSADARIEATGKAVTPEQIKADGDALAKETRVALFDSEGKLIQTVDKGGGRPYALLIDYSEVSKGLSPHTLNRLAGTEVAGAAVFSPKFSFSTNQGEAGPIALKELGSNGKKSSRPLYERSVLETIGTVPEGVGAGTNLGLVISKFSQPRGN